MTEELGKIEKPEAARFANKRKLYLIPLLYTWSDAPPEYTEIFRQYWQQVKEHIANLESKIGSVNRIYHESISMAGEEGLKVLEQISPQTYQIAIEKCQGGANMEALEDTGLVEETMDWERHLMMGFISQKAAQTVSELFTESSKKRYEFIAGRLEETFKENETAILFIREGHHLQFPMDMEVFSVAPPALNEIHRWLRDRSEAGNSAEEPESPTEEAEDSGSTKDTKD